MKRNIILLFSVFFALQLSYAQKNKFVDILNSKKLGASYKSVKESDKDEYYQQYYWLVKMEELKKHAHLSTIKPKVLYQFVREISPVNPTKGLSLEHRKLRSDAQLALNQFFGRKDWTSPILIYNLESFVDPSGSKYYTGVNPEKIVELVPKKLYHFTSFNKKTNDEKMYYLWFYDDKHKIVDVVPKETDKKFFATLRTYLPKYEFNKYIPEVKPGKKGDKQDMDYFYFTPFQKEYDNIVYRTKDFEKFELVRYKKDGGPWTDVINMKKQN